MSIHCLAWGGILKHYRRVAWMRVSTLTAYGLISCSSPRLLYLCMPADININEQHRESPLSLLARWDDQFGVQEEEKSFSDIVSAES